VICKRCLRPYVRPFTVNVAFSFRDAKLDWEGCADCAYHIQRQLVDFMLKVAQPTRKVLAKQRDLERIEQEGTY
jgi:hypothetical protein